MKLTDHRVRHVLCAASGGSSQGGKYGGLFRSLRYVAMMDGRRTSARVSIGNRKRKRREEREMVRTSSSDLFPGFF